MTNYTISYLRDNNIVVFENEFWLVIENMKFHKKEFPWHTAFIKKDIGHFYAISKLQTLPRRYKDWEWMINHPNKKSVKRFHVHLLKNPLEFEIPSYFNDTYNKYHRPTR